jgi:hypothetical protein
MKKKKEEAPQDITSVILEQNKGKFPAVVVIGVNPDGNINLDSNLTSYSMLQYILNKASFNLFVHESAPKREEVQE